MGMSIANNTAELQSLLAQVMALPNENEHLEDLNAANGVSMTSMPNAINETQVMADDQALLINELSQTLTGRAISGNVSSYDLEIHVVLNLSSTENNFEASIVSGNIEDVWNKIYSGSGFASVKIYYEDSYAGEIYHGYANAIFVEAVLNARSMPFLFIGFCSSTGVESAAHVTKMMFNMDGTLDNHVAGNVWGD